MKKILLIALVALGTTSCRKFLAERSQTDVVPRTTKDFGEILYSNGYPTSEKYLQPFLVFMDDDIQAYNGLPLEDQQALVLQYSPAFLWQPDFIEECRKNNAPGLLNYEAWTNYYQMILGTNVALQYLDNSEGSEADKGLYKGEAYTLRAFYHFMLVNLYGKPYNDSTTTPDKSLGVPIKTSAELDDALPVRNTVKEVYDQVVRDLDSGMYLLEKYKSPQKPYRISHIAAHLLASRVYLFMEQWDKVIEHASYVIGYHPELMDLNDWGDVDPATKPVVGVKNIETIWHFGSLEESVPAGLGQSYDVSHDLAKCFQPDDLRSTIFFQLVPDFFKIFIATDYIQMKNTGTLNVGADLGSSWRSAEAYLNRAEAYIQKYKTQGDAGAADKALADLNLLRSKRIDRSSFTDWTVQPGDVLLQMCRDERRRELFMECGHRWFDLRRYGMPEIRHIFGDTPNSTQTYVLKSHDPQYTIPIPIGVLERNTSLVQNPEVSGLRQPE